jgi:capsular exopolysaccharide synthesis family protein
MARATAPRTSRTVPSLGDYTHAIWRRKSLVVAGLVLGLTLGAVVLPSVRISQATYQATVRLKVVELVSDTIVRERPQFDVGNDTAGGGNENAGGGNALQDVDVARRVLQRLGGEAAQLEAADVTARLTATPVMRSPYVDLTYTDTDEVRTREIVRAYAKAWATRRNAMDAKRLADAMAGVDSQIDELQGQVAKLTGGASSPTRQAELSRGQARLGVLVRLRDDIDRQQLFLGDPTGVVGIPVVSQLSGPTPRALVLVLGLLIGLLAGIGLSLLLEAARPSVVTPADAERATGLQVVASVPHSGMRSGLPVVKRPFSPAAEGYRRVAGALERRGLGDEVRTLAIASADQGEGKSLLAVNLAHSLARKGRDVVLVSADLRRPTLDSLLSLEQTNGLAEWLEEDSGNTAPPLCPVVDGLLLLPAGQASRNPGELLTADRLRQGLQPLVDAGFIVLIDTPPALWWAEAMTLAAVADATLLVVRSRTSRWRAIEQLAEGLRRDGVREIGMVLLGDRRRSASRVRRRLSLRPAGRHQSGVRPDPTRHEVPSVPPVSPASKVSPIRPPSRTRPESPLTTLAPPVPPVPAAPRPARHGGTATGQTGDQSLDDFQRFSQRFEPLTAQPDAFDPKEGRSQRTTSWTPAAGGSQRAAERHD